MRSLPYSHLVATHRRRPTPAFTLVELLVVMAVIGILISAILVGSSKISEGQKRNFTKTIMRTTQMAIDQFASDDPLKGIYNTKDRASFGTYPPYQLAGNLAGTADNPLSVRAAVEPFRPPGSNYTLTERVYRDIGRSQGAVNAWVDLAPSDANDDIRALYLYLKTYNEAGIAQLPEKAIDQLTAQNEYVNPAGTGTNPGNEGLQNVFGIVDGWGVPLNYFLYVKLERTPSGIQVTNRIPVLMSRGISRERYQRWLANHDDPNAPSLDTESWIFSESMPTPACGSVTRDGGLAVGGAFENGWVRAKARGSTVSGGAPEVYGYLPAYDGEN